MNLDCGNWNGLFLKKGAGNFRSKSFAVNEGLAQMKDAALCVQRKLIPQNRSRSRVNGRCVTRTVFLILVLFLIPIFGCATTSSTDVYHDPAMDFPAIRTIAILPLTNLSDDRFAAERVRDVLSTALLATEAFYVLPSGEVTRGMARMNPSSKKDPSPEEIIRFSKTIGADAVITGIVREYGPIRSGTISTNTISLSLKMIEAESGKVVWSASTTKGGITPWIRLFGGGGKPMNEVTRAAVEELLDKLFY